MNFFKFLWDRLVYPAGQDIIIGQTRDFLRHPDRYMRTKLPARPSRPGRLGFGYLNRYKNELDLDEPDQEIIDRADFLTGERATTDTVAGHGVADLASFSDVQTTDPGPERDAGSAFAGEFHSTPEKLSPLNIETTLATDGSPQQDSLGLDFSVGQANQGTDLYQAEDQQAAVLA